MGVSAEKALKDYKAKWEKFSSPTHKAESGRFSNTSFDRILRLQRTVGNQAVQRIMKCGIIQARLIIGQPDDEYEKEADRAAEQVTRTPLKGRSQPGDDEARLPVKPLAGELTPLAQRRTEEEEEGLVQAQKAHRQLPEINLDLEARLESRQGGGRPLSPAERSYFEPRFGRDFSRVRLHIDDEAGEAASMLNAHAFTHGEDVYFGSGRYAPESDEGRRLLAHELAHVVQQEARVSSGPTETGTRLSPSIRSAGGEKSGLIQAQAASGQPPPAPHPQAKGPELLLRGLQAIQAAQEILERGRPPITVYSSFGPVELQPGAIWSNDKILIYASPGTAQWLVHDRFYEWDAPKFVRDEWLDAIIKGAKSAEGIVILVQIELAFLQGIFCPWYIMLGVGIARLGLFYLSHKEQFHRAFKAGKKILTLISQLYGISPTFCNAVLWSLVKNIPKGIEAEDVAFFLGRIIRGVSGLSDITMKTLIKLIAKVASIVALTHLPSFIARGTVSSLEEYATLLRQRLAEEGIEINEEEAKRILKDFIADPRSESLLGELRSEFEDLLPVLDAFKSLYGASF